MTDTKKFKSVAVDHATYNKLQNLAEEEHRNVRQQIGKLTADAYDNKYSKSGIGSATVKV